MTGNADLGIIPLALVAGIALPAIKKAAPKLLGKLLKKKKKKSPTPPPPPPASVQVAPKPRGFLEGMTQETKVALAVVGGVVLFAMMRAPGRQQGITVHVGSKR